MDRINFSPLFAQCITRSQLNAKNFGCKSISPAILLFTLLSNASVNTLPQEAEEANMQRMLQGLREKIATSADASRWPDRDMSSL